MIGYWKSGLTVRKIKEKLLEQDIVVSVQSLSALIKKYKITSSVADLQTYKPLELFKEIHYEFINDSLAEESDLTARPAA